MELGWLLAGAIDQGDATGQAVYDTPHGDPR